MRAFDPKHLSMPRKLNCNRGSPKIPKRSSPNLRLRIPHSVPGIELLVEVFNSDVYENWVNSKRPATVAGIHADGPAGNGLSASADITIPANSLLVFARDQGDF